MGYRIRIDEPGDHPRVVDVTDPVDVGRQVDGIRLFDPTVSRRHVTLEARSDGLLVTDLGSSYGTFVHGYRLAGPVLLQPGDVLLLGNSRLTVLGPLTGAPALTTPPPPAVTGDLEATVASGLTPPPPTGMGLTPPPPGTTGDVTPPATAVVPAASPAPPSAPPAPPPASLSAPSAPPPAAPSAPLVAPPVAPASTPLANRPAARALVSNVATALAFALPVGLLLTIADTVDGELPRADLPGRLVVLGAALLLTVAGLLGVTAFRGRSGAGAEDPSRADRRNVAIGVLPAWALVSAGAAVIADPLVGLLTAVAVVNVAAIWLWAGRAPAPPAVVDDPGAPVRPAVRQVAVAAIALVGLLAIVVTGLALARALDGTTGVGVAVVECLVVLQAPVPLLGLLRP